MSNHIIEVQDLSVAFKSVGQGGKVSRKTVVDKISFNINKGEILAVVGESGSGKSVSALSILQLLPYPTASHPSGKIMFDSTDIILQSDAEMQKIRGKKISMIFQEPMTSLNPLHKIGNQIAESIIIHNPFMSKNDVKDKVLHLLDLVELGDIKSRLSSYPHELSGGQRQRIMIAMALANDPELLIADEPTTALDVTVQATILKLLKSLQKRLNMAILFITHDLTIVEKNADRVLIMHQGRIVEQGDVEGIFKAPQHSYTQHLLSSSVSGEPVTVDTTSSPLSPAEGVGGGVANITTTKQKNILSIYNLKTYFPKKKSFFGKVLEYVKAVDDISFSLKNGHTLGIVGESGSGKSTVANTILRLVKSQGEIIFNGKRIDNLNEKQIRPLRGDIQIVFQDPFSSLNPRMSVAQIVGEGLLAHNTVQQHENHDDLIDKALTEAGLSSDIRGRYPHEFSGGQRQRIGIARAIILKPKLIILDEPTSALDISTQSEILGTLKDLQKNSGISYIFISHDLRVIKSISHDIIVMRKGKIVEQGSNKQIFDNPQNDYTKSLINAAFEIT